MNKVSSGPRQRGTTQSRQVRYHGGVTKRTAASKALFDSIDGSAGFKPRGKIAMGQFIEFAYERIFHKDLTVDMSRVDFGHVDQYTEEQFLDYLEKAVNDPKSGASVSFYNYLLTIFAEADTKCKGQITFDDFDELAKG